jgi:transcriptional/translational regulatory protein YebC/TACO1
MAVMVEALTDNRNRTAADLRLAFSKNGGNLGENGCVSYLFEHRSEVSIKTDAGSEERLLESLLDLDADGYDLIDTTTATVFGPFSALEALQDGLRKQGWNVEEWGHQWATTTNVSISDPDTARSCLKLLDALEGLDDVRSVSANLEIKTELEID